VAYNVHLYKVFVPCSYCGFGVCALVIDYIRNYVYIYIYIYFLCFPTIEKKNFDNVIKLHTNFLKTYTSFSG
jgi:hypothetical protein